MNEISLEELASIAKQRPKKRRQTDWLPIIVPGIAIIGLLAGLVYAVQANRSSGKQNLVASVVDSISGGSAKVLTCTFKFGVSRTGGYEYRFVAAVRNDTGKPIDELIFYIRSKDANRTIPSGECVDMIDIPNGIEPGETKTVEFRASLSDFGVGDYPQPPEYPFEVAVVDAFETGKLHQKYAGYAMTSVDGNYQKKHANK